MTDESQERMDDQAATIAKLNKALQGKIQVSPRQNWASSHPGAEPNWDGAGIWDTQNLGDRHRAAPRALRARITSNVSNPVPRGGGGDNTRPDTLPSPTFCPLKNEKVLQDILKQQEEHMLDLIDKSGEVTVRAGPGRGVRGGVPKGAPP